MMTWIRYLHKTNIMIRLVNTKTHGNLLSSLYGNRSGHAILFVLNLFSVSETNAAKIARFLQVKSFRDYVEIG